MQELLEAEAANAKSIEEEIEEERAKVDAKTPITEQVFDLWSVAGRGTGRVEVGHVLCSLCVYTP